MRVERAMMAADVTVGVTSYRSTGASTPAPGAPVPTAAGKAEPAAAEAAPPNAGKAPVMPGLSASDRAAIATATGFYITASGKVTPEGMPPWGFIVRYIEQRQAERSAGDPGVEAVEGASPVVQGDHVDVTV